RVSTAFTRLPVKPVSGGKSAGGQVELQLDAVAGGQQALLDGLQLLTVLLLHLQMRGADTEGGQQQQLIRAQGGPLVLDVSDMSTQQRSRFLEKLLLPARSLEGI